MDSHSSRSRKWSVFLNDLRTDAQASRAARRQGSCPSLACFPEPSFAANEDGGGKQTAACFLVSPDGWSPLPAQSLSADNNMIRPSDRHPPGRRRRRCGERRRLSLNPGRLRGAGLFSPRHRARPEAPWPKGGPRLRGHPKYVFWQPTVR